MYSVGNFFSTVTKFYNEINPATLSGAIDIIVVQQANGDLACSPFHVRFGKLSVLRPQEKVVEVRVNGQVIAFPMKVGDAGEAFFVLETDDYVPDEFATSPIAGPSDESELAPVDYFDLNGHLHGPGQLQQQQKQQQQLQGANGLTQADEDALLDNGYVSAASGHGSAFEESLKDDSDRESIFSASSPPPGRINDGAAQDMMQDMPGSFGQSHVSLLQEPASPLPSLPQSQDQTQQIPNAVDTKAGPTNDDIAKFPVNSIFPTVMREELPNGTNGDNLGVDQSPRSGRRKSEVLFDMTGYKTDSCSESSDDEDLPRGILSDSERHHRGLRKKFGRTKSHLTKEQRQQLLEDIKQGIFAKPEETPIGSQLERQASRSQRRKKRAGIPNPWQGRKGRKRANSMPAIGEPDAPLPTFEHLPAQRHAAQTNNATAPESNPKRSQRPNVMSDTEMEYEANERPTNQGKEWTWGWGTLPVKQTNPDEDDEVREEEAKPAIPEVPVEIETREFQMGSTKCAVAMSLCGEDDFGKDLVAGHKAFRDAQLTFEAFSKDPATILADKRLVCYIDGRFYTWSNAVPQLAALLFFHQPLSDATSAQDFKDQKSLAAEDRPSSTRFGTISRWFRKAPVTDSTSTANPALATTAETDAVAVDPEDELARPVNKALRSKSLPPPETTVTDEHAHPHLPVPVSSEKMPVDQPEQKRYAKTLRLTSDQLRSLGLNKGANTVSFSVTSSYQGTATCVAKIFLWDHDSQVVISDIDGTITKSDALGHIFAMAGRDWTHLGVAKLFTDIRSNGYHILYLTSRAIGQADYTRKYLQKVEQNSYQLPDGPVIMSPDRLFSAFHREVIIRKPEVFKMACLRDVKKLFGDRNPFYAGFGNRITDALSYRSVNVPPSRIFTIDSYGEVKLELLSAFKSSYLALNDLVNEIFPGERAAPEFNDWNFWKSDLPKIDLPELPLPANNYNTGSSSSSLLLSTTNVAKKVASLTHSNSSSSLLQPSSPTSPAVDTKSKRLSYERGSYAGALLGRNDTWTSDDENQDRASADGQGGDQRAISEPRQQQQLKDETKKAKASSPSMLSALVPTRLIRAVRSGSTSSHTPPVPHSPTSTPSSPDMNASSPGALPLAHPLPKLATTQHDHDVVRPVSIPSPPPLDSLMQTDEDVARASKYFFSSSPPQSSSSRPSSFHAKSDLMDDLVPVKEEEVDDEEDELRTRRLLNRGRDQVQDEQQLDDGEYQGEYEDAEEDELEYEDDLDQEDEDDEYLDQIEENLEEPFL
ncbi:phosphatidate phosphatase LPIN [Entomortierella parvispora]|uniref:phosphatidate phosphatase n=2 Tax=Mortierellaceae TaxID=4854 RepID=A0A9P3H1F2_9FUNG|nr:phosphatidate phosphatase LPIN [Entomortierella parvispora]